MNKRVKNIIKTIIPYRIVNLAYLYRNKPLPMNLTDGERETALAELYRGRTGKELSFDCVTTFPEKLQWYKLYYSHPCLGDIVCKYKFKSYIKDKLGEGYTIPL